ncbi:ABC transporter substrate-binding protein (plasmid) [Rhizobium sullae]|uniref:ABC transporter substrate-binding protein n=1 Tax=Rhizobium sullae TaxID=50338 RepID=A0A2N0DBY6_RHISU|nr:ABC transporter substrate-binding protein [Rhizobium sullae]PKA43610.1 ABC transporter substrate-binding protein [Rhizobium sullae]UWU18999.1 ABC transporter substrate-binding protein [Rhizobium sullae]
MFTRRTLLGALAASPFAPAAFAGLPRRIVCLEWTSAEMLVSLGVPPLAVADLKGYRDWVAAPALPLSTLDLGARGEPNLEVISAIRPDLIAGAYGYGIDETMYTRFAPVFSVPFYEGMSTPLAQAEAETVKLGAIVGRQDAARNLVSETMRTINDTGDALRTRPAGPIAIISMFDDRQVRVYGRGSLFQDVLDRVGLVNAWTGETSQWGFSTVGIDALTAIGNAHLISLDPIPPHIRIRIEQSSLWTNLPCVRAGNVATIPPVWPFGGLAAAARFATFIRNFVQA